MTWTLGSARSRATTTLTSRSRTASRRWSGRGCNARIPRGGCRRRSRTRRPRCRSSSTGPGTSPVSDGNPGEPGRVVVSGPRDGGGPPAQSGGTGPPGASFGPNGTGAAAPRSLSQPASNPAVSTPSAAVNACVVADAARVGADQLHQRVLAVRPDEVVDRRDALVVGQAEQVRRRRELADDARSAASGRRSPQRPLTFARAEPS